MDIFIVPGLETKTDLIWVVTIGGMSWDVVNDKEPKWFLIEKFNSLDS